MRKPPLVKSAWHLNGYALDLGAGEIAATSLALENREHVILLDDLLARRIAQAAEMWISTEVRNRILLLANES